MEIKMRGLEGEKEVWVTSALSDAQAIRAFNLGISLKNGVGSTRKTVLLLLEHVSPIFRECLGRAFDGIVTISNAELSNLGKEIGNVNGLENALKIWCWKLTDFEKCVYLAPNYVAKKNCDELFGIKEFSALKHKKGFAASLFVFKPSVATFEKLVEAARFCETNVFDVKVLLKVFETISSIDHVTELFTSHLIDDTVTGAGLENNPLVGLGRKDLGQDGHEDALGKGAKLIDEEQELNVEGEKEFEGTLAVVGMSCRFPGANTPDEYWKLMAEGREAIQKFPSERANLIRLPDTKLKAGFLNCPVDEFDAKFFGMSPREAVLVDPQQRLLLELTWECLENAGINPQRLRDSETGVYVGIWQQDYERLILESRREEEDDDVTADFLHVFLGNKFSSTASRISFCLGFHGPAVAVESGCSSSLTSLHLACQSLRDGETSLAIVTGVNLILLPINPFFGEAAHDMDGLVFSRDFRCKTFDESADGFVRAEGCGVVALKRFEDARRDGDNILAIVKGSAVNNDGTGTSFGTPNEKAQERVFRTALKRAKVAPAEVSFVETHGTGTVVGDPIEMYAVGQVYSEGRTEPLLVGSVKTNIGHSEAAAGIAGLIKVILCMQNKQIPPHRNFKNLNPRIELEAIPARIPMQLTEWTAEPRIAAVSSFSLSATNAHVILQQAPKARKSPEPADSGSKQEIFVLSAKSEESLLALIQKYVEYLKANPELALRDIVYGANVGRAHFQHCVALVASNTTQLLTRLSNKTYTQGRAATHKSKTGFLFTGQGSQYFGMTKGLAEAFPAFSQAMSQCDALFEASLGKSLLTVLFQDESLLNETLYCQPAIFCTQFCLIQLWKFFGIKPDAVLGHSVGEFAAAVCAGILSLTDAMSLVSERSRLVSGLAPGSMLAIRASEEQTKELIKAYCQASQDKERWVDIAAINSAEEAVVSLNCTSLKDLEEFCLNRGVKYDRVSATHAFHSREMDSILVEFGQVASRMSVGTPVCTYVSGTLAKSMEAMEFGAPYWQRHLRDTVRFSDAVKTLWSECRTLVEIGATSTLLALAMQNVDGAEGTFCPTQRKNEEPPTAFQTAVMKLYVSGLDLAWESIYGVRQKCCTLPTYAFQRQKYWIGDDMDSREELSLVLHPLLGKQFLSPLPVTVFCQTLRLKQVKYLEDHKVADYVVMPAAGLLETFLAAGREVLQGGSKNKFSITIQNFQIEAALALENKCRIQTLVTTDTSEDTFKYNLSLSRKLPQYFDKWKRHATAEFFPSSTTLDSTVPLDLEALKASLTHKKSLEASYKAIAELGINFGPKFQSIASAWFGPNKDILAEIPLPAGHEDYICHPVVLDAMLQVSAFREHLSGMGAAKKALYLPLSIQKFSWLAKVPTSTLYAHCTGESSVVRLYMDNGEPLASMEGLELIQTTVNAVVRAIREDVHETPDFMTDRWRQVMGKTDLRIELSKLRVQTSGTLGHNYVAENYSDTTPAEARTLLDACNSYVFLQFCKSIQECGWPWPAPREPLSVEQWKPFLPSALTPKILTTYFYELELRGYVAEVASGEYTVLKALPTPSESESLTNEKAQLFQNLAKGETEVAFYQRFGACLPLIFQGKLSPLAFMFPADESEVGAIQIYTSGRVLTEQSAVLAEYLSESLAQVKNLSSKDGVLRILEVGAGSGSSTTGCLEVLKKLEVPYHYTFTDISPLFLSKAKKKLGTGSEMSYQLFNIEQDPLTQGLSPEEFDIVIGSNVVHATASIHESLANLKKVLKVNGLLFLGEMTEAHPSVTFLFGMLDSWWRYDDFRLGSKMTALISAEQWVDCLDRAQFDSINYEGGLGGLAVFTARNASSQILTSNPVPKHWLILNDSSSLGPSLYTSLTSQQRLVTSTGIWTTDVAERITTTFDLATESTTSFEGIACLCTEFESTDVLEIQRKIITAIWTLLKTYEELSEKLPSLPKIAVVTRGVYSIGDSEPGNPSGATVWGLLKSFRSEMSSVRICLMDLDSVSSPEEDSQVFSQLWSQDDEAFVAFRSTKTFVLRLVYAEKAALPISLPNTDRYKLINPQSGSLVDIEFGPMSREEPEEDEVEVEVRACALNFRDLFMILKPEGFELPDTENLSLSEAIGLDFSGVVSAVGQGVTRFQVGDEVCGLASKGALASHTVVPAKQIIKFPSSLSFTEAATLPVAFTTVLVCLVEVAKVRAEDRVLIHVATGGVGLAAIQVVSRAGAEIYATAGSKRKRAYLRGLGIKHVYHSRDTTFADSVQRDTHGQGVSVVLNSLTGPGFKEAALRVCAQGARFLEIGHLNVWTPAEVEALRPDVKYTLVDLSDKEALRGAGAEMADEKWDMDEQILKIQDMIDVGTFTALPLVTYPLYNLREAFTYFQKAKHIGKVVVEIPKATVHPDGKMEHKLRLFNSRSTYLVTGGLGGLGVEVIKWMRAMGAESVVLVGRSLPSSPVRDLIEDWNRHGSKILVLQTDVGDYEGCRRALEIIRILGYPPLRGIIHAAGVLRDGTIKNQSLESIEYVFRPKVYGSWHLHTLTLKSRLDFFVMFSSLSGTLGMIGQCNHSAANRYLDALAHYRVSLGLPATTINWGGWSDVGAAAHIGLTGEDHTGMRMFTPAQGISALQKVMTGSDVQVVVTEVRDWNLAKAVFPQGKYLAEMKSGKQEDRFQQYDYLVEEIKQATSFEERQVKIQVYMEALIKETLGLPSSEVLDIDQNFTDMGLDSLMAMEMKNRFQSMIGARTLSVSSMQENRTIRSLSAHVAYLMENECLDTRPMSELVKEDVLLPEDVCATETGAKIPSEMKHILLTGSTGYLGIHCLVELLRSPQDLVVHCLIRAKSEEHAIQRLTTTATQYGLDLNSAGDQVRVLVGDVSKPRLGLSEEAYASLVIEIDGAMHFAARVDHVSKYNELRGNVRGMVNMLKFAGTARTKSMLYASSLPCATKTTKDGLPSEEYPDEEDLGEKILVGYIRTKFICEKLALEASKRGLPVTTLRFPGIFCNSATGFMPKGYNSLWATILACIRIRMIPEAPLSGATIMAVDSATKVSVMLFLSDTAERGIYNITAGSMLTEKMMLEILSENGINCEVVTREVWREALFEDTESAALMAPLKSLFQDEDILRAVEIAQVEYKHMPTVNLFQFNPKILKNLPEVADYMASPELVLRRQIEAQFNRKNSSKDQQ